MTWLGLKSNFCHYLIVFIFRCMNALVSSLTPSISSSKPFLVKGFLWRGEGGSLKSEWKQTTGGGEGLGLSLCSFCEKSCLIVQTANRIPLNKLLKVLLKRRRRFFKLFFYIWTCKCFYCCYRIYICVKNIAIFYVEFTKK